MLLDPVQLAHDLGWTVSDQHLLIRRPGRIVARLQSSTGPITIKADSAAHSLTPEVNAIGRLSAMGLPVPKILHHQAGPPDVLIFRWIDGESLRSSSPLSAQHEVGDILHELHTIPAGPPFSAQATIGRWIADWTNSITSWWSSITSAHGLVSAFRNWQRSLAPTLSTRSGTLTLFDGRPDHFLIHNGHLAGMIDLHDVGAGDPAMDLAVLSAADPRLLDEVLQGSRPSDSQRSELAKLIPFYVALRHLAAAEWNVSQGLQTLDEDFVRQLDRTVDDDIANRPH